MKINTKIFQLLFLTFALFVSTAERAMAKTEN